ncbi:MAG TPA: VCBS repeat-containing protein [Verrucomicrobiales bacterium]|nr:VCBS repeat-containing protein [Verrucomicrobiales bacterium]
MRSLLLSTSLLTATLAAQEAPVASARPVRLDGPEVAKVSWDSGSGTPGDFDGDGRLDLALINNENAKLVLLYQRAPGAGKDAAKQRVVSRDRWEPVIEDSRFEKASLPTDQRHFAMAAGDFDGDGKLDLAMTGATDALTVRFQGKDATFAKTWKWKNFEPLQNSSSIVSVDVDGDKKADLAVLGKGKLLVFRQKAEGGFGEPVVYTTGEEKAGYLMAQDADGDGAVDLLYLAGAGEGAMRFRRQTGPGAFASEVSIPYQIPADGLYTSRDAANRLLFTRVNARSSLIERHAFVTGGNNPIDGDTLLPTVYSPPGGVKNAVYAYGDLDGDGLTDIAMADGKAAQIVVFLQRQDGSYAEPVSFPSLAGINGLTPLPWRNGLGCALAVSSQKEGCGISFYNKDGRLEFPVLQTLKGPPAAMVSVDLKGDGKFALVVLTGESREWTLNLITSKDGITWSATPAPLKALKREPLALKTGDLNADGKPDLVILTGKDPALILLANADGSGYGEPLAETALIRSQLADLSPERVTLADITGDKRCEIITCGTGYARALQLTPDGKDLVIGDQYNARQPDDKLATPAYCDIDGDGTSELVFSEGGTAWLQVLKRDSAAVYRSVRRLESGSSDTQELLPVKLGKAGVPGLLLAGRERFRTAPLSGGRPRLELVSSYETDLKNCRYYMAVPGDLNADGKEEITAFDSTGNLMEVLSPAAAAGQPWQSLMHFVLFEENIHFRGRKGATGVREAFIKDFTGDGKADLLLLLHDRVLLYPQN